MSEKYTWANAADLKVDDYSHFFFYFFKSSKQSTFYTVLQNHAHIGLKQNLLRSTTLDIITRLLDNAAFVCVHVVGRFSKDFSEVLALRSRGFQLHVEWMTTVPCAEL